MPLGATTPDAIRWAVAEKLQQGGREETMNEVLLKEGVTVVKNLVAGWAKKKTAYVEVSLDNVDEALAHHLAYVECWSGQISLSDLPRSRSLSEVYIRLSFTDRLLSDKYQMVSPEQLLEQGLNNVLLGHPGSGKTTTIKYLCQCLLHEEPSEKDRFSFPLLVRLRDLGSDDTLVEHLFRILGIHILFDDSKHIAKKDEKERLDRQCVEERILVDYLNEVNALLLLDGLDEMHPNEAVQMRTDLQRIANLLVGSKFILTCRIGALDIAFDSTEILSICPFDREQVETFSAAWLSNPAHAQSFMAAVDRSPYADTVGRPLILVNLCMLYDAYGELPEPPMLVYLKVVQLLIEEWDRQRDLRRYSRYAQFGPERKRHFLAALAYFLTTHHRSHSTYEQGELKGAYRRIHTRFGLPLSERDKVVREIESHTGLFVKAGFQEFEFSHKSLQEFLCADHISRLPDLGAHLAELHGIPNECAVATALSSDPNAFFAFLVFGFADSSEKVEARETDLGLSRFWNPYLTRLIVERATFSQDDVFGAAFLTLCSEAWEPDDRVENRIRAVEGFSTFMDLLDQLYAQDGVKFSVREACRLYFKVASSNNCAECRIKAMHRRQLPVAAPESIVVHKRFTADTLT